MAGYAIVVGIPAVSSMGRFPPQRQEPVRFRRNKAAKKYHGEFAMLNFKE